MACLLAGCAALPAAEKAGALGSAISATGKYVRDTLAANRTLAIKSGEENQVLQYMQGKDFTLRDDPRAQLPQRLVASRLAALGALEQYGDALAKAVDQGTVDKLEQASVNLGNAAAGLALAAGPEALVAAPVIKVAARASGFLIGSAYAAEIHGVIVARNDSVRGIVHFLRQDMYGATKLIGEQAKNFVTQREANLKVMRGDFERDKNSVDRTLLYNEYKAARQDVVSVLALVEAAKKYDEVLTALVNAHEAVATDQLDGELLLRKFVALSADLSELITTVRKENP